MVGIAVAVQVCVCECVTKQEPKSFAQGLCLMLELAWQLFCQCFLHEHIMFNKASFPFRLVLQLFPSSKQRNKSTVVCFPNQEETKSLPRLANSPPECRGHSLWLQNLMYKAVLQLPLYDTLQANSSQWYLFSSALANAK